MTICLTGTEPKTGSPAYFLYDDAFVAAKFGTFAGWITNWAMGLPTTPQVTADFCATEPPTDMPTVADWAKLALPPIALVSGTYTRFGNQIKYDKWADLCQCAEVANVCAAPQVTNASMVTGGAPAFVCDTVDGSVTSVTARIQSTGTASATLAFTLKWYDAANVLISTASSGNFAAVDDFTQGPFTRPSNATGFCVNWNRGSNVAYNTNMTFTRTYACGSGTPVTPPALPAPPTGFPTAPAAPTCGTSQDICNLLNTINSKLDWQRTQVDLIQRQAVPFAYIVGTAHTGLTGNGSFAVQGILGLVASVTTAPSFWGRSSDNPSRYIPAPASIVPSTASGDWDPTWLNNPNSLVIDPQFGTVTTVKYSCKPGVTISITELKREP